MAQFKIGNSGDGSNPLSRISDNHLGQLAQHFNLPYMFAQVGGSTTTQGGSQSAPWQVDPGTTSVGSTQDRMHSQSGIAQASDPNRSASPDPAHPDNAYGTGEGAGFSPYDQIEMFGRGI